MRRGASLFSLFSQCLPPQFALSPASLRPPVVPVFRRVGVTSGAPTLRWFSCGGAEIAGMSGGMPAGVDSRIKGKIRRDATCDARRRDGEMFSARWRQAFYRCFRSSYRRNSTYSQSRCVRPWFRCSGVWASQVAPLYCGGFRTAEGVIGGRWAFFLSG